MYILTVTITTSNKAQPVIVDNAGVRNSNTKFQSVIPQYNGLNTVYIGDASVSPTNGLLFTQGSSLGSAQAFNNPGDLLDFYLYGTAGDNVVFMVFP